MDSFALLAITLLTALLPLLTAYLNAKLIDQIISVAGGEFTLNSFLNLNNPLTQIVIISTGLHGLFYAIQRLGAYFQQKFDLIHLHTLEDTVNEKISNLDVADFEDTTKSDAIRKATDNIWKIQDFFELSMRTLSQAFTAVIAGTVIFTLSPLLLLLIFITTIPGVLIYMRYIQNYWEYYDKNVYTLRKRWWVTNNITYEGSVPENRVLGGNKFLTSFLNRFTKTYYSGELSIHKTRYKGELLTTIISVFLKFLVISYLMILVLIGKISIGDLTFYHGRSYDLADNLDYFLSNLVSLLDRAIAIEQVKNVLEAKNKIVGGNLRVQTKTSPEIEFVNVSFKYPNTKKYSIKNLNIKIKPFEEIAIVGENGAGKTTFLKLLLRFYDPTEGKILINGKDIKLYDLQSYYSKIGALFQDYNTYKFLTINENISFGRKLDKRMINDALKKAEAYSFIQRLEKKGEHELSKQFKNGTKLSSGQEQKIALARMFYRNSPILILDEPTASIDAISEYKIFNRIYKFMENKTVIIISHRFSTVRNAQKIYVFDKGEIIEQGSHEELLKVNGKYAQAFKLQAKGYTN